MSGVFVLEVAGSNGIILIITVDNMCEGLISSLLAMAMAQSGTAGATAAPGAH